MDWDLKNVSRVFFLLCIDDNVQIQIPGGQNRPNRGFWENQFWKNALLKKTPQTAKIALKLTLGGLKCTPEVWVPHKTCSTICRTHIQAILDQKKLTGLTFSLGAQVSKSKETIREFFEVLIYVPDTSGMNNWKYLFIISSALFLQTIEAAFGDVLVGWCLFVVESRKCFGENFQGPHNSDQIEVGLTIFNFLGVAIQQTILRNIAMHQYRLTDPHHS